LKSIHDIVKGVFENCIDRNGHSFIFPVCSGGITSSYKLLTTIPINDITEFQLDVIRCIDNETEMTLIFSRKKENEDDHVKNIRILYAVFPRVTGLYKHRILTVFDNGRGNDIVINDYNIGISINPHLKEAFDVLFKRLKCYFLGNKENLEIKQSSTDFVDLEKKAVTATKIEIENKFEIVKTKTFKYFDKDNFPVGTFIKLKFNDPNSVGCYKCKKDDVCNAIITGYSEAYTKIHVATPSMFADNPYIYVFTKNDFVNGYVEVVYKGENYV
jgi:hypothetical protein